MSNKQGSEFNRLAYALNGLYNGETTVGAITERVRDALERGTITVAQYDKLVRFIAVYGENN